jgi:hypothetical protein
MMEDAVCNLHTGLQGAGKTLMTIAHVEALRLRTGRQVFYSGIRDCKLEWTEFGGPSKDPLKPWWTDPTDWYKLPEGSIIVIDEAQRLFRPRGNGTAVPAYEQALETLRHNGHTLFLITQGPKLITSGVRELAGVHRHFMRKFGSHWVTCHEWASVHDNVAKSRKDSISAQHRYPKEFFDKYTSAEVHTVKFGLPLKIKLALLLPVFVIGLTWYFFWGREWLRQPAPGAPVQTTVQASQAGQAAASQAKVKDAPITAQSLFKSFQPRIDGLPFTAPRYDALTAPVRVPVVVGCWVQGDKHGCVSQQGTFLTVPFAFAKSFTEAGAFVDFDAGPKSDEQAADKRSSRSSTPDRQRGPQSGV